MHPRLTPFSGRIALETLRGQIEAEGYTQGSPHRIAVGVVDLDRQIGGPRDRQLLWGAAVLVIERREGHAFVQAEKDLYCGWIAEDALAPPSPPSHAVCARFSQLYPQPKVSAREILTLPFGARVEVTGFEGRFARTPEGYIPAEHLRPIAAPMTDPVAVAEIFLGTPYLWGGNSGAGIDCSGLAQAAMLACAIPCPGDSDMQAKAGVEIAPEDLARGDLVFWTGHVALVSGPDEILHATGAFMTTLREPLSVAEARIRASGGGEIIARRRLRA